LKLLLDENFNNDVLKGLLQEKPDLDVIRAQDVPEVLGKSDPELLAWAAEQGRIVLTHDTRTLIGYAYDRVRAGEPMPGVTRVKQHVSLSRIIEDILLMVADDRPEEFENQVTYLPLNKPIP
jgi:Domain of unknown function (DUF5615)